MILVTTGTNGAAFDRLLGALEGIQADEEMIVQHGPSTLRPGGATCVGAIPFQEFVETAQRARVLITHAGVGSILVARMTGHRPILVPRLKAHAEAVDDHQVDLAKRLADLDAASIVTDTSSLATMMHTTASNRRDAPSRSPLVDDLKKYLAEL